MTQAPAAVRTRVAEVAGRVTDTLGGPSRRRVILLLALVLALQSADTATIGAAGANIERSLRIGNASLGLLASVTVLMAAVGCIPGGILADRVRRTRLLVVAIVVWSCALLVSAASVSFEMLLVTRLALGALVAVAGPAIASLAGDFFNPAERARVYGLILSGELIGGAFGFLISGEVTALLSWRAAFVVLALPGALLAWAIHRKLPEPERGGQTGHAHRDGVAQAEVRRKHVQPRPELVARRALGSREALRYLLRIPTIRVLILSSSLGYFFLTGLQTFAVVYVKRHFGVSQGTATAVLALIVCFSLAGAIGGGRLADRLLARGHLSARIVLPAAAYVVAALVLIPGFSVGSLALAAPLFLAGALAIAATNPPLDAARLDIVPSFLWGRAEALRSVVRSVAQALAPFMFGVVSESFGTSAHSQTRGFGGSISTGGLEYAFLIMISVLFLAAAIMLRARRTYPRDVVTAMVSDEPDDRR